MSDSADRKLSKCGICNTMLADKPPSGVCSSCFDYDQELFDRVKKALRYGERITPEELANRTGVDAKHIKRWTSLGRLSGNH